MKKQPEDILKFHLSVIPDKPYTMEELAEGYDVHYITIWRRLNNESLGIKTFKSHGTVYVLGSELKKFEGIYI